MEAQTIAIIMPILSAAGLIITGAVGWGKLSSRLNTIEKTNKKLVAVNGRPSYITRIEFGEHQKTCKEEVLIRIKGVVDRIEDMDERIKGQDERWEMILIHVGKVQQFMEDKR
ncbi:hypothetical protein LCGC14_1130480 [marine sediment metagenome]|uniref:Uncharacterized protein n=1 Tax=marine sediment metagenome TaxID=412755 RepID=A0A0F9M628_9ZZZZ